MLNKIDDLVGKDLGYDVIGQLLFYFAVFVTPIAMPLAVLLSSLMTFGNLGEHFELTAIKSAGISLVRALLPIFIFVLGLTVFAFYSNNYFVPKAALEAYSLLYDIKQKKPALDLKEGAFYNGIPDFSIKVGTKFEDGSTLKDIIIYDHRNITGNKKVTLADSGKMYTFNNDRFMKLELFDGDTYGENDNQTSTSTRKRQTKETLYRSSFSRSEFVIDLSSFVLDRTDKSLFESNRIMRNLGQLTNDVDSSNNSIMEKKLEVYDKMSDSFYYHLRSDTIDYPENLLVYKDIKDSLKVIEDRKAKIKSDSIKKVYNSKNAPVEVSSEVAENQKSKDVPKEGIIENTNEKKADNQKIVSSKEIKKKIAKKNKINVANNIKLKDKIKTIKRNGDSPESSNRKKKQLTRLGTITKGELIDSLYAMEPHRKNVQSSLNLARQSKSKIQSLTNRIERLKYERNVYEIQWHKILANSVACIIMFLIGAPLGAIIKRGGLGIPVLVSILFFIIYYVLTMTGEKYAKQGLIEPVYAIWSANLILLPIGLVFLRQARNDARIFEADFYKVLIERFKKWFGSKNKKKATDQNIAN